MSVLTSHAAYKKLDRAVGAVTIGANLLGALITFFYLALVQPIPEGSSPMITVPLGPTIISFLAIGLLLFLGNVVGGRIQRHYPKWVGRILDGAPISDVPPEARREVLQYPASVALVSLTMWFVAGFFFGFLLTGTWQSLVSVFGVGGILTSAIVYFAVGSLWRPVVWLFFPDGRATEAGAWRNSVKWRLLLGFVLVGLYPAAVLSLTAVSRAEALTSAENPDVILQNLYIALGVISLVAAGAGIALAVLVSHSILDPLQRLRDGMGRVAQNDLSVSLLSDSNDELGYVSQGFNEMVSGLRRAEVMRNLLNLYVSPEVAREALEHGTKLGGQLVECSVLFSDIRGFTALSEQLPPEHLIDLLNRYMSRMVDVVIANGGLVNKFGGDSLLAVFGSPLNPAEEHAAQAIRAALHMQKALKGFNVEQVKKSQPELEIGIGIASGPVVAGNVGGEGRIEYTVIGDTVNLAARLQDLTKQMGRSVLASAATVNEAARVMPFAAEPMNPVEVRGKTEMVEIYALVSGLPG
ncbi:MAG: adenylate/guanylate cyclase domain-containing protein [Anaerolineales bacterium]